MQDCYMKPSLRSSCYLHDVQHLAVVAVDGGDGKGRWHRHSLVAQHADSHAGTAAGRGHAGRRPIAQPASVALAVRRRDERGQALLGQLALSEAQKVGRIRIGVHEGTTPVGNHHRRAVGGTAQVQDEQPLAISACGPA